MTKELVKNDEIISFLSESSAITKAQAKSVLNAFYDYMHQCLKKRKSLRIPKVGTFSVVKSKARKYAGFGSGNVVEQGEIDRLKFTPSNVIKTELKSES
jgi:DNA-binding protein HU-beta